MIKRRRSSHPVDLAAGQQARRMSFVTLNCNLHGMKGSDKVTAISNRKGSELIVAVEKCSDKQHIPAHGSGGERVGTGMR
jgi:hypothetical protein